MKKLFYVLTLSLAFAACNNESETTVTKDSTDTAPVNDMSNPNRIPGSNTPGEAMGTGDTASYEQMSNAPDSSK